MLISDYKSKESFLSYAGLFLQCVTTAKSASLPAKKTNGMLQKKMRRKRHLSITLQMPSSSSKFSKMLCFTFVSPKYYIESKLRIVYVIMEKASPIVTALITLGFATRLMEL